MRPVNAAARPQLTMTREIHFRALQRSLDRPRGDFNTLERVLKGAQRTVGEWGGQFTLVYLPAPFRYSGQFTFSRNRRKLLDHIHSEVLALGDKLRIPVIDATGAFPDLPASESAKN